MNKSQAEFQTINFPLSRKEDWRKVLPLKLIELQPGPIIINCLDWFLSCRDFQQINALLEKAGLKIKLIQSNVPETIISASSLGYQTYLNLKDSQHNLSNRKIAAPASDPKQSLLFHQGTLRSGESLEAEGDLLLFGDINPGAKVSAEGDVLVLGRLLGIAHAGKSGNNQAKIMALQLRPLQLRISNKVARGPEEKPQEGLAEEALIESGRIVIKPARTNSFKRN
ncbi:septum site-determining protein MinC [Prochlorococcus sp. MIT 1307]|uniref:septum site-determining protein MinC n=1 Tax=Prochlorococcus sp. MIT 1307 TaxID=3096219 RepID=UPI002A75BB8E|nr:septum site-determining protein MinC [Prochlorococcus sp. MIT 1307]